MRILEPGLLFCVLKSGAIPLVDGPIDKYALLRSFETITRHHHMAINEVEDFLNLWSSVMHKVKEHTTGTYRNYAEILCPTRVLEFIDKEITFLTYQL